MRFDLRAALPFGILVSSLTASARGGDATPAPLGSGAPVVVELFSSEGCSSCPPADAYLAALDRAQPIAGVSVLALEWHVDYWDSLGWKDPFARAEFSARQQAYARALDDHRTFTPEIVFDGTTVMPGGDQGRARELMQSLARMPRARVALGRKGDAISVVIAGIPPVGKGDAADVWLAVTESGLVSEVRTGENAGRTLAHAPIVRSLQRLGPVDGATFQTSVTPERRAEWKPQALRSVVFVQERQSRHVLGSAAL